MLKTSDLHFELPEALVATSPAQRRDDARLLVVRRRAGTSIDHVRVSDLPDFLRRGDVTVFNTTRVIPARLVGVRRDTGGGVEGLFLGEHTESDGALVWRVMLRAKRLRLGCVVEVFPPEPGVATVRLVLRAEGRDGPGSWLVGVEGGDGATSLEVLERVGRTPLPPYILSARKRAGLCRPEAEDRERYQTVYARQGESASVAAPTAGLHFTPDLLRRLTVGGVRRADVTLHVGPGTFRPVETETIEAHTMHAEWCRADPGVLEAVRQVRTGGGRVVAVGTTAARAVESLAEVDPAAASAGIWTRLLVTPGYQWRLVDGLLTNFHLPRSTLMALVAALLEGGVERLRAIYDEAVRMEYRFFSYGDAMLLID